MAHAADDALRLTQPRAVVDPAHRLDQQLHALPIGNGALGAMIFGGPQTERLQLNEKTLWTGGPGAPGYNHGNWVTPRPGAIDEIQAQIDRDIRMAPGAVATRLGQPMTAFGSYQNLADTYLDMTGTPRR